MEKYPEDPVFTERMEELQQKVNEYHEILNLARQEFESFFLDIGKTGNIFADIHLEYENEASKLLNRVRQFIKED